MQNYAFIFILANVYTLFVMFDAVLRRYVASNHSI